MRAMIKDIKHLELIFLSCNEGDDALGWINLTSRFDTVQAMKWERKMLLSTLRNLVV